MALFLTLFPYYYWEKHFRWNHQYCNEWPSAGPQRMYFYTRPLWSAKVTSKFTKKMQKSILDANNPLLLLLCTRDL